MSRRIRWVATTLAVVAALLLLHLTVWDKSHDGGEVVEYLFLDLTLTLFVAGAAAAVLWIMEME